MKIKEYFKSIDYIRLIACLAVLLYHLTVLKGGFLAVCVFFVLSGYLSCISAFKKKEFSYKEYFFNNLLRLYVPLLVVVMITIGVVSLIPSINWMNLKPETTSVLLGYNNYWQLNASLDYFARHIDSPFMHLWYISILLQFDLVFPFIFNALRRIGDTVNKVIPCVFLALLVISSCIYFYSVSMKGNIMVTYYDSFARMFSFISGMFIGFVHIYYEQLVPNLFKKKIVPYIVFGGYVCILFLSFCFIGADFKYLALIMIVDSLITCRLIDYGTLFKQNKKVKVDGLIKSLSSVSYEVYLIQYPIIFLLQLLNSNIWLNVLIVFVGSFALAYLLHYILDFKFKDIKFRKLKIGLTVIILGASLFGGFKFVTAKDYKEEMDKLEQKLADNEKLIEEKQKEYALLLEEKKNNWAETISDLENDESKFGMRIRQLPVVGIGDSVMLGAVDGIYKKFPNSYIDAKISRTAWVAKDIVLDLQKKGLLEGPVVFNLGTNGDCSEDCKDAIIKACGDREIFWINVTNDDDVHVNDKLDELATKYDNFHVIDWAEQAKGHSEYFVADGIHLTTYGVNAYSKLIYDSIYKVYYDEFQEKKESILSEYQQDLKSSYTFFGNDILINSFNELQNLYPDAKYVTDKNFTFDKLKEELVNEKNEGLLSDKIILLFDGTMNFTEDEYQELINLCENRKIYVLVVNNDTDKLNKLVSDNFILIDFNTVLKKNNNYLDIDGIHLTDNGNEALIGILKDNIQ